MKRLGAAVLALASVLPSSGLAAEVTRVASSFEDQDPFGLFLDVAWERTQHRVKIVREAHQDETLQDVNELNYTAIDSRLNLDARVGLFRDLEFHYRLPIVFSQNRSWGFVEGTDETNSTLYNNCLRPDGELLDPACPTTGRGRAPVVEGNGARSYRGGLDDMTFGLKVALLNERRDDTKPTWVLGLDYTAPTADPLDPTVPTSPTERGKLGDRHHKYKFFTGLSRKLGFFDPYFEAHYTLPVRGSGWYSNCDHPDGARMGAPDHCGSDAWGRSQTGIQVPHRAGVQFGTELNSTLDRTRPQRLTLDVRGVATYVGPGRTYNEVSDLLGKLLTTGDSLELGGRAKVIAHAADWFQVSAAAGLFYTTDHLLTAEPLGVPLHEAVTRPEEVNPTFDWRTDLVSRRLRATDSTTFRLEIGASVSF